MDQIEEKIVALLNDKPEQAFSLMYDHYYQFLVQVVYRILKDESQTQDVIQGVFIEIWKKKEGIVINNSFRQYLRRAAINRSLNLIRSEKKKREDHDSIDDVQVADSNDHSMNMEADELNEKIYDAIDSLPERCRLVFNLSRFEDMSYKEIAAKLGISVKTVENQITKALKLMRNKLIDEK